MQIRGKSGRCSRADCFDGWQKRDNDTFAKAIADFAVAYANQTGRDHAALETAVESGRIAAENGI
ncbi:MAG: hypothetical protein GWP61_25870 [Chloroflexi bacterium]|nr:hypothetical protein [Chloroflexota bacterium]